MVNQQSNDAGMRELALFAGAGGGILGGKLLGWRTVCAVEWDAYAASVLVARQNDGCLEAFPVWDDVQTFDGRPWRGLVDVVSGGFPCTDISCAGKGAGIDGEASGMWRHMARIVGEVRPRFVFVENSPMLTLRGLDRVLGDLASLGYDAQWGIVGAYHVGAPHRRERIWVCARRDKFLSYPKHKWIGRGEQQPEGAEKKTRAISNSNRGRHQEQRQQCEKEWTLFKPERSDWWSVEPNVGRMANGVASRVDRLKAIGNGQVSSVAALAFNILK